MNTKLVEQLKRHEGFSENFYLCAAGKKTIGYGRNVASNPKFNGKIITEPMSRKTAEQILIYDIGTAISALNKGWPYFVGMEDTPRKDVCINMTFNLGIGGFMKFKKLHEAIRNKKWDVAAEEMNSSAWYGQVGDRSIELVQQMRTGKYIG